MIYEFVPGLIIAHAKATGDPTPTAAADLSNELVTTLARLHGIPAPPLPPGRSASSADHLRRQVVRWTDQWERNKNRELTMFGQLASWLRKEVSAIAPDYPATLVHGDYRLDNLVLDPGSRRVRAVLDWEMSTLGDPMTDLALLLVYWEEPTGLFANRSRSLAG
jgi:aminoglycoside phosphotransferase (APT) family kinase protein